MFFANVTIYLQIRTATISVFTAVRSYTVLPNVYGHSKGPQRISPETPRFLVGYRTSSSNNSISSSSSSDSSKRKKNDS